MANDLRNFIQAAIKPDAGQLSPRAVSNVLSAIAANLEEQSTSADKAPARAATTANITLSGTQTIDGVAVAAGDRVLVKDQSTAADNGLYVASATAWARTEDANRSASFRANMRIPISEGTLAADTAYQLTNDGAVTLGTTAIQFAAAGGVATPAGADTQIQFNGAGSFGGASELAWNNTTKTLTVGGPAVAQTQAVQQLASAPAALAGYGTQYASSSDGHMGYVNATGSVYNISLAAVPCLDFFPHDNMPPATAYATLGTIGVMRTMDFDTTTAEYAQFDFRMPSWYGGRNLVVVLRWAAATQTTGGVVWVADLARVTTATPTFGTAVAATATAVAGVAGTLTATTITLSGASLASIVAGDMFRLRIKRDTTDAGDTLSEDASFLSGQICEVS